MSARQLLVVLALLSTPAAAQTSATPPAPAAAQPDLAFRMLTGSWALRVEGTVVFRFDLASDASGWSGTWARPQGFATDGASFGNLAGPPAEQKAQSGRSIGEWAELTFSDGRPGAVPDVFRLRLVSLDRAELLYTETGYAPFVLERVAAGTPPGPWAAGRIYRLSGAQPGVTVRFNLGPVAVAPNITPRPAPAEQQGPPAVVGR